MEQVDRHPEVGAGLVEATDAGLHLAAVRQRQGEHRSVAAEIGVANRDVELRQRGSVVALLEQARSTVRADARHLERIAGALGVLQCPDVVPVVGDAVAVGGRDHRRQRVRRGERPIVVRSGGRGQRDLGEPSRRQQIAGQPGRGTAEGGEQGRVGSIVARSGGAAVVHLDRRWDVAAQVQHQTVTPRVAGAAGAIGGRVAVVPDGGVPLAERLGGAAGQAGTARGLELGEPADAVDDEARRTVVDHGGSDVVEHRADELVGAVTDRDPQAAGRVSERQRGTGAELADGGPPSPRSP